MQLDLRASLCGVARAASVYRLANAVCDSLSGSRSVALVRMWVADETGTLTLTGSGGTPSGGGSYARVDGEFREMAIGEAKVAEIAASQEPLFVLGLRGDEEWLTNPSWASRQGVRAFLALPLIDTTIVVGLLAIFERTLPSNDTIAQLQLVADVTAARIADFRARADVAAAASGLAEGNADARARRRWAVITRAELRRVERDNIESALSHTKGKVFGVGGAAALLGMRPTTLASRIKALGIHR